MLYCLHSCMAASVPMDFMRSDLSVLSLLAVTEDAPPAEGLCAHYS